MGEIDLCPSYKPNVSSARPLAEDLDATEGLWMLKLTGQFSGMAEDSIVEVTALDALDEPIRALWISIANPINPEADSLCCVPVPPVEKGVRRIQGGCTTFKIIPNQSNCGFKLSISAQARLPAAAAKMPCFAVKLIVRRDMQDFSDRLRRPSKDAMHCRIESKHRHVR